MIFERGNVLFIILIAIALFAALSYAVIHTGRGGSKDASEETSRINVSQLVQFATSIERAILQMKILGGIEDRLLDFRAPLPTKRVDGTTASRSNANCLQEDCRIFEPDGGGVSFRHFEQLGGAYSVSPTAVKPGHNQPLVVKVINIGSDKNDVAYVVSNVDEAICEDLHSQVGLPWPLSESFSGESFLGFWGPAVASSLNASDPWTFGDDNPAFQGHKTFCYTSGGGYHFLHVVLAR
jgi:hypothetical protein